MITPNPHIGHIRVMRVLRIERDRVVLDGEPAGEIDLPRREAPDDIEAGKSLDVFILTDSAGRPVATTDTPHVTLGRCASLDCVASSNAGAFLDWGLNKHLLLPFAEQRRPIEVGQRECVQVYVDNSGRLAASSRLDHRLSETPTGYSAWQVVSLLVSQRTDLGFKAVIDDHAIGLLYRDEIFTDLRLGDRINGYIKHIRPDGRIDLALQLPARHVRNELAERIVATLRANGGSSALTDRSSPASISEEYGVSKKNYKRALATLYKERRVRLDVDRVVLLDPPA